MDVRAINNAVIKLHNNATDGVTIINKKRYILTFNRYQGQYDITLDGVDIVRYNTRKISVAKKWLREEYSE